MALKIWIKCLKRLILEEFLPPSEIEMKDYFFFDLEKAITASAYLCKKAGGKLDILKLIKMLYWADRLALQRWMRSITGDAMVSMTNGPVLSRIYNLADGKTTTKLGHSLHNEKDLETWRAVFRPRNHTSGTEQHSIQLLKEVENEVLSEAEIEALDQAFATISKVRGKLSDWMHKNCPEWEDPSGSQKSINPKKIFIAGGASEKDAEAALDNIRYASSAKAKLRKMAA